MSANAIELAIWRVTNNPADRDAFREDMAGYLARFAITPEERDMFLAWNIKALLAHGVNPGLMLGAFSAIHGRGKRAEYLEAMRANAAN